jgi:homoserine kinase
LHRRRLVRVPASSANLGPGFDVLAAALDLHMELEVVETGRFAVHTDLPIATDRRNLAVRGFAALHPVDALEFTIRSDIPLAGGLGTSAAAIVAGLVAADSMFELGADVLAEATRLEGHPDNVAAALLGGFVLCCEGAAERLEPPAELEALLVVPEQPVRTAKARAALPGRVPMSDAVFNVAHSSLLVLGLARGDLALVARGLGDRLHQPRRAHLYQRSWELIARARELGALGATISGAGPSVLVWCRFESTGAVAARLRAEVGEWAEVLRVPFTGAGASVTL